MSLYESGEMYLESILVLSKERQFVRSIDVCEYLGYSKPSVSRAISLLKKSGHVKSDTNGYLLLTEEGRHVAEKIYERHKILTDILISVGVDADVASDDACKIEHHISDASFEALKRYFKKK